MPVNYLTQDQLKIIQDQISKWFIDLNLQVLADRIYFCNLYQIVIEQCSRIVYMNLANFKFNVDHKSKIWLDTMIHNIGMQICNKISENYKIHVATQVNNNQYQITNSISLDNNYWVNSSTNIFGQNSQNLSCFNQINEYFNPMCLYSSFVDNSAVNEDFYCESTKKDECMKITSQNTISEHRSRSKERSRSRERSKHRSRSKERSKHRSRSREKLQSESKTPTKIIPQFKERLPLEITDRISNWEEKLATADYKNNLMDKLYPYKSGCYTDTNYPPSIINLLIEQKAKIASPKCIFPDEAFNIKTELFDDNAPLFYSWNKITLSINPRVFNIKHPDAYAKLSDYFPQKNNQTSYEIYKIIKHTNLYCLHYEGQFYHIVFPMSEKTPFQIHYNTCSIISDYKALIIYKGLMEYSADRKLLLYVDILTQEGVYGIE